MPIILICIAFLLGIILAEEAPGAICWLIYSFPPLLLFSYYFSRKRISPRWEILFNIGLLGSFMAIGSAMGVIRQEKPGNHISGLLGCTLMVEARVMGEEKETQYGKKIVLECLKAVDTETQVCGKVLTYYNYINFTPRYGDIIHVEMNFRPLPDKYPSYQKYLQNQDIFATARARSFEKVNRQWSLKGQALKWREQLKNNIHQRMPDQEIGGLAVAMLLGDRTGISQETKEAFRKSGLSHILAISGLHIGIVYLFLNSLLSFLDRLPMGKATRTIITIIILAAYAFITGASPSVCRAVLMISMISLGKLFFQETNGLNLLATTALLLLVIDPRSLFQVGFQLSFSAVAGIMLLTPLLTAALHQRFSKLKPGTFDSIAVCISAQVFTAPLIFWHFGTFPTYFLIANALLLPLVALVVNVGVIGTCLIWVPGLNSVLFGIMDFWLWVITSISAWIGKLPGSEMNRISFYDPGFCTLISIILLISGVWSWKLILKWFRNPKISYLSFRHGAKQSG